MQRNYQIRALAFSLLGVCLAIAQNTHYTGQTKIGIDFILTGDYGWMEDNMGEAKKSFKAMDDLMGQGNNETNPYDLIDFMFLAGDNLYPNDPHNPIEEEFDLLLSLFQGENMKNIDAYAVRGNHDCKFDRNLELALGEKYSHWVMPSLYYSKEFEIGNGNKFGVLFVDSCLLLCSTFNLKDRDFSYDPTDSCPDEDIQLGNKQYEWIISTLNHWDKDPSILWKATVQHHVLFGKHYHDYTQLLNNFMPLLIDHGVDFYLNGHEHTLVYANYPLSQSAFDFELQMPATYECQYGIEMHFEDQSLHQEFVKGEHIHQITSGASGKPGYSMCADQPSVGRFKYAQNKYYGWTQIHLDSDMALIQYRARDEDTLEIIDLYEVEIKVPTKDITE